MRRLPDVWARGRKLASRIRKRRFPPSRPSGLPRHRHPPVPPVSPEYPLHGFGAGVQIFDDYQEIQIEEATFANLEYALTRQYHRRITWKPGLEGEIPIGATEIWLNKSNSGLIVEPWPDTDLKIVNDGHATADVISWGDDRMGNDGLMEDFIVKEWRSYLGSSFLESTSRFSDNMGFSRCNRFFVAGMVLLATIDKLGTSQGVTNGTFHRCAIGCGLADPVPPHEKDVQHNRTWSMIGASGITVSSCLLGIDDWRIPANAKSAGIIDFCGNVIYFSGRHGAVVGRHFGQQSGWNPIPARVNYRNNKYITGTDWTGQYLIDAEAQDGNPAGAEGCCEIYFGSDNDITEVVATPVLSPIFGTVSGLEVLTPHAAPAVPNFAGELGLSVEQYVAANAGLSHRSPHELKLWEKVGNRTIVQIQSDIDELLA